MFDLFFAEEQHCTDFVAESSSQVEVPSQVVPDTPASFEAKRKRLRVKVDFVSSSERPPGTTLMPTHDLVNRAPQPVIISPQEGNPPKTLHRVIA